MNQGHSHGGVKPQLQVDQENSAWNYQQALLQKQNGQQRATQQNLSNPMIIDKKYNANAASRQSFNMSM